MSQKALRIDQILNSIAPRIAKTRWSFGYSECNSVEMYQNTTMFLSHFAKGDNIRDFLFAFLGDGTFPKWRLVLKNQGILFPLITDPP